MARLIDAELLKQNCNITGGFSDNFVVVDLETLGRVIDQQPTVDRWIPCSERMPKKSGTYLISGVWGSGKEAVGDCDFSVNDGYFRTAWNFDVLAWMPLPEPYKAGEIDG